MKRSPLRRRSKSADKWTRLYSAELAKRLYPGGQTCAVCKAQCGYPQGHHYAGTRAKANILRFVIVGSTCHLWIHAHPNLAREAGWLARVNGTLADNPAVAAAEERFAELTKALNEKER